MMTMCFPLMMIIQILKKMYNKVKGDIGFIKMKDLNTTTIQKALNNLPSDAYRKRVRSILHSMFQKAVDDNIIDRNPARKAVWNVQHDAKRIKQPMTLEQEKLFVDYIYRPRVKQSQLEHAELMEFMLETGMRLGEATGLEWKSVDFDNSMIYVNTNLVTTMAIEEDGTVKGRYPRFHYPKTEMGKRKIPMTQRARELLLIEKERDNAIKALYKPKEGFEDLVFVSWLNTPIYDDTITLIFAATTTSSLKLDWAVNWDKKVLTMPISRKSIIRSKYLERVCLCGIGEVVGCGSAYLQNLFYNDLNNYIIINFGLLSLALGIMGGSFHILFAYMFGGKNLENSEILLFLAYGISVGIMAIFLWGIKSTFALDFEKLSIIPILILVLALLVCIWAYKFTVIQYRKKEL